MSRHSWLRSALEVAAVVAAAAAADFLLLTGPGATDFHSGWRHYMVWTIVFLALSRFLRSLLQLLVRPTRPPERPDLYTSAQAELAAEKARG